MLNAGNEQKAVVEFCSQPRPFLLEAGLHHNLMANSVEGIQDLHGKLREDEAKALYLDVLQCPWFA